MRALVRPRGGRCACQTQVSSGIKTLVTPTGYEARLRVYGRCAGSQDSVNPAIPNLNKRRREREHEASTVPKMLGGLSPRNMPELGEWNSVRKKKGGERPAAALQMTTSGSDDEV